MGTRRRWPLPADDDVPVTWCAVKAVDDCGVQQVHVVPTGDDGDVHVLDHTCRCAPWVNEDGCWVHDSFDGREAYDDGLRKPH